MCNIEFAVIGMLYVECRLGDGNSGVSCISFACMCVCVCLFECEIGLSTCSLWQ